MFSAESKEDPELSFDEAEFTIDKTDVFTAPTLNNPHNLEVSYISSNTSAATVDAATGAVTIKDAGVTIITASFDGNDTYGAGSASYTLSINAVPDNKTKPEGALFFDAFNNNLGTDFTGGHDGSYSGSVGSGIIVPDEAGNWSNLGQDGKITNCGGAYQCVKFGTSNDNGSLITKEITLTGNGTLTFAAAGWGDTKSNVLTVSAEGATLEGDINITLVNGEWNEYSVDITDAEGSVVLTFSGKRGFIDDILVMAAETPVPETVAFSIKADNGYGTFCSEYPVQFTPNDNVEAYIATGINEAKTSIQTQKIEDGYVPAGVGVIVKASAAGDYTVHTTQATDVEELAGNMMVGCTEATTVPSEGCYIIYAGDGCFHPCFTGTIPAGKAYLNIAPETVSPTEGKVLDIIEGNIDPTAINEIETTTENAAIYTLGGVRVKDAQQKGIYIINGKKVVK